MTNYFSELCEFYLYHRDATATSVQCILCFLYFSLLLVVKLRPLLTKSALSRECKYVAQTSRTSKVLQCYFENDDPMITFLCVLPPVRASTRPLNRILSQNTLLHFKREFAIDQFPLKLINRSVEIHFTQKYL